MTAQGEVSYKVKRAILILREFTVGQLTDVTGADHSSVETVVQRLLDDEILVRKEEVVRVPAKRGRPRQFYALSENPELARRLNASVEAFQVGSSLLAVRQRKPESALYLKAVSTLDALEQESLEPVPELLREVEQQLTFARRYEAMLEEGAELADAYLDFAEARLANLQGNITDSQRLLAQARSAFQDHELGDEVRHVDEYTMAGALRRELSLLSAASYKSEMQPTRRQEPLLSISGLAVSPALARAIMAVAQMATAAVTANATLSQDNQRLQAQLIAIEKQNVWLRLEAQNAAIIERLLHPTEQRSIPTYPRQGFPAPVLKESQSDLLMRDLMEKTLVRDFWPEANTEQQKKHAGFRSKALH